MRAEMVRHEVLGRRGPATALTTALAVLVFAALGAAAGMEQTVADLSEAFPEALTAFIPADVPGGYVVGEVFHLMAPLALVAFAVMSAASMLAGEEERGTMAVLASLPVSRAGVLGAKAVALLAVLTAVAVSFVVVVLLAELALDIGLEPVNTVAAGVHLVVLAAFFGSVALLVGALSGRPSLASGTAGALAVASYVADSMLPLAGLDRFAPLSPWHYYSAAEPLVDGLDLSSLLVLVGLTLIAGLGAFAGYARRDLRG